MQVNFSFEMGQKVRSIKMNGPGAVVPADLEGSIKRAVVDEYGVCYQVSSKQYGLVVDVPPEEIEVVS